MITSFCRRHLSALSREIPICFHPGRNLHGNPKYSPSFPLFSVDYSTRKWQGIYVSREPREKRRLFVPSFFTLVFFLICATYSNDVFSEQVYKWIDENGRVFYGEHPPDQLETSRELNLYVPSVSEGERRRAEQRLKNNKKRLKVYDDIRREEQEEKKKEKEKRAQVKKECARLRNRLKDYKDGGYIWYERDSNGNRVFFADEEINRRAKELESKMRKYCK